MSSSITENVIETVVPTGFSSSILPVIDVLEMMGLCSLTSATLIVRVPVAVVVPSVTLDNIINNQRQY